MVPPPSMQPFEWAPRFHYMDNAWNTEVSPRGDPAEAEKTRTTTQARQGVSGVGVRYVLAISLSAALALMAVAYFFYAAP